VEGGRVRNHSPVPGGAEFRTANSFLYSHGLRGCCSRRADDKSAARDIAAWFRIHGPHNRAPRAPRTPVLQGLSGCRPSAITRTCPTPRGWLEVPPEAALHLAHVTSHQ